jgi:HNH endonuclease
MKKTCETCGAIFERSSKHGDEQWRRRRFCSYKCRRFTRRKRDPRQCFEENYIPEPNSGCWIWTGTRGPRHGYGQIRVNGAVYGAHRLSYELNIGPIPDGLHVLHKCDNRLCVNPDHLYAGTQADNGRDMRERNRSLTGARNHATKLNEDAVRAIRASDLTNTELADVYGVTRQAIQRVRLGLSWGHV